MKKPLVMLACVLAMAVGATLVPAGASGAQAVSCDTGVLVQGGRCVAVDGNATRCDADACVEYVQEAGSVCPADTVRTSAGGVDAPPCERTEPAAQRGPECPAGTRGEVGECFIYVAIGPDGCPVPSVLDDSDNCRRAVQDTVVVFFCDRPGASLLSRTCTSFEDTVPQACPAGTTRFDGACWNLNGLIAPESCPAHGVSGTVQLTSGLCRVPLEIPTGSSTCVAPAVFREYPSFLLIERNGDIVEQGPETAGCVDNSASVGIAVASCFFPGDDRDWVDIGSGDLCTWFAEPDTATCPSGFTRDDLGGGVCRRFEPQVDGQCPPGALVNGASCVFDAAFAEFTCPAGTARYQDRVTCAAGRAWQGGVGCGQSGLKLLDGGAPEFGLPLGCFPLEGPQPDRCNGVGTLADCHRILEPAPRPCPAPSGCVTVDSAQVIGVALCRGRVVTLNLNLAPGQPATNGNDVILGTAGPDVIDALAGDDVVCAGGGNDVIRGGDGADLIIAGTGDDRVEGGNGDDRLFGISGDDVMNGGPGRDTLHGNRGSDTLDGGADDDRVFGYADDDTLKGGPGNDKIFGHFGNDTIDGDDGDDRLFGWGDSDVIRGGLGNDLISGNFGDDTIDGGDGDDLIYGADGDDTIGGGNGDDTLNGNSLNDRINGGNGNDSIDGGIGSDVCNGDLGIDTASRCEVLVDIP